MRFETIQLGTPGPAGAPGLPGAPGVSSLTPELEASTAYIPVTGDIAKLKVMTSATGAVVTLPPDVFSVPTILTFEQGGAGPVKIVGGPGVSALAPDGLLPISAGRGYAIYAMLLSPNTFSVFGGLVSPKLDATLQMAVVSRQLTAPPGSPVEGDRYIPKATATGAWVGQENNIAHWIDGAWSFYEPKKGWLSGVDEEDIIIRYNGAAWVSIYEPELGVWTPTLIGQTSGSATLLTAEGGYVRSGKWVDLHCHLVTLSVTGLVSGGQLSISNLPFVASTLPGVAARTGGIIPFWSGLTLPAGSFSLASWIQDDDRIRLYRSVLNAGGQTVTGAHITDPTGVLPVTLYCTISYKTV